MSETITLPRTTREDGTTVVLNNAEEQAGAIIRNATLAASATGLIPVNGIDVAANSIVQTVMIRELAELYGHNFRDHAAATFLTSLVGSSVARLAAGLVSAVAPSKVGAVSFTNIAISGIYTASVGAFYNEHFEKGGDLEDISLDSFTDFFISEVKSGELSLGTVTNPSHLLKYLF